MATQSSSSSSYASPTDKVTNSNDLLTEILLRLPVRSLLRFKSVSKNWYILITKPAFKLHLDPPSGLFLPVQTKNPYLECDFIPFDVKNPVKPCFRTLSFDPSVNRINIEHSCNGLMLCSSHTRFLNENRYAFTHKYYIYNPTLNQFVTLPRFETYDKSYARGMTLAFDPLKSTEYVIVYVCGLGTDDQTGEMLYQIGIYTSQTRVCKKSDKFSLDEEIDMKFKGGVYYKNAVHWINRMGLLLYMNLDEEIVRRIQTSFCPVSDNDKYYSNCMYESRDQLLVVEIHSPVYSKIKIHELKRDYSEWSVKYQVDLDKIGGLFVRRIMNPKIRVAGDFVVLSLVLGEKEDDSFLVLKIRGTCVRFNLVSKTFHKLHDFTAPCVYASFVNSGTRVIYQLPYAFQFRESLYSV